MPAQVTVVVLNWNGRSHLETCLPALQWRHLRLTMLLVMVVFQEPRLKVRVKSGQREVRSCGFALCFCKTGELWKQALLDGAKESFNFSSPAGLARPGKDQRHFQISSDLFQMATGKV